MSAPEERGLAARAADALDARTGYRSLLRHALDEPVRGGAGWAYVFGSTLLAIFLVQVVTGVALMTSYAPSETTAWASVHFITFRQAGGWLVRGLHHYGAQTMVVLLAAHLVQVAAFGAYKKPREVTWWVGLVLFAVTLAFALTGYLLPWDQKGYWATRVATNIAGTVPVVGGATQRFLLGGADYGSLTLTRFYALHVVVLPATLALMAGVHVALFRKHGVTPAARADLSKADAFYPKQLGRDVLAALLVLGVVFGLTLRTHGAPLDAPADPASDYPARPEWYFLSLFQLLKYFHGPAEVLGTIVLPLGAGLYLFALPLLDRKPGTALGGRGLPLAPLVVMIVGALAMTGLALRADAHDPKFQEARRQADERAEVANRIAMGGVPPEGPLVMLARAPEVRGPELFAQRCGGCHTLGDLGDEETRKAPKLAGWSTEAWILEMIHDPDGDARFGRTAYAGTMPSVDVAPPGAEHFTPMPEEDKRAVAAFLASQGDEPGDAVPKDALRTDPARVARGKEIVTSACTSCHLFKGEGDDIGDGLAPELSGYGSVAWVRAQIANPATAATYRENALDPERKDHMPRFDEDMKPEDIDLLARWVRARARGL